MMALFAAVCAVLLAITASEQSTKTVTLKCPEGFQILGTSCYLVSQGPMLGSAANAFCQSSGGKTAVVENEQEMDLLKGSILKSSVYLGINLQEHREAIFTLLLKFTGHSGYTNFQLGEPNEYGAEACVLSDASSSFEWKDVHCNELHHVLCKTEAVVSEAQQSCGDGNHRYIDSCYWVDLEVNYNWTDAISACSARNMRVTSIHSQQENDFIYGLTDDKRCWIGLSDTATEGEFVWSDDTPLDYEGWDGIQPNGGNCVEIREGGTWGDDRCELLNPVVCRAPVQ